jgi:hypothetical protein
MDDIKEAIKYETELLKMVWLTTMATIGGSVGFLFGDLSPLKKALAVSVLVLTIIAIVTAIRQDRQIRTLLRQLKKEQPL